MQTFVKRSFIDCEIEDLYDFHTHSSNIARITPLDIDVDFLTSDLEAREGLKIAIQTTQYFIPTLWEVEILQMQKPNCIVDIAHKSPFKYWKHTHQFNVKGNMSELVDIVEFEMPFGFLGKLALPLVKKQLQNMFDYRHARTKEILEE